MCEIFGVSAREKITINHMLKSFYSHSNEHRNGWGLALLDRTPISIDKEPVKALDSAYLKGKLQSEIKTKRCISHIRMATIGGMNEDNTHPFTRYDYYGRRWVFAHNGTIFESDVLTPYQYIQKGTSDSERILLYIIDVMDRHFEEQRSSLDGQKRMELIDEIVRTLAPGNKLNLMIEDGEYFYVHKNEENTLSYLKLDEGYIFSTKPLTDDEWKDFPMNQLMVYKEGDLVYEGIKHNNTYVMDEEEMKLLFMAYAEL
ncbi:MAG: class II glutamine amidotransferase [Lachnospiraceae bacterium]|nr:class II glutamine amidotransferase [Lachnospiraceae bacterium]